MKGGTLFSGGGGFCLGMVAAGVDHAWGIEYDDKIAQVARDNGLATITADILQCDPADFEAVDFLHASPPCPNFSNAKTNAEETENDRALAAKVCQFITELLPRFFTLENVYQYRNSKSWETIARTLLTHGYQVNYWHVNMADYGVPQTRKRMIAIARRDGIMPMLPPATHSETPVNEFFERRERWVSWHEVVKDIFEQSKNTSLPNWVELYKPKNKTDLYALMPNSTGGERAYEGKGVREIWEPAATFTSNSMDKVFYCYRRDNYRPSSRHFARYQSFNDDYALPESESLACHIIGNAVPPLFAQRLVEWLK